MAKTNSPLLSFNAQGQVGHSLVYAAWRGVQYARRYTIPSNPRSSAQTDTRNTFKTLNGIFKLAPALLTEVWSAYTQGKPMTNRNAFVQANLRALKNQTTMAALNFSNGAKGGLPPASVTFTPGTAQITAAITAPTGPIGWTVASAVAAAIKDGDPQTITSYVVVAGEDTTASYAVILSGLTPASLYRCGAWLKWTKSDGTFAYSVATMGSATPT